MKLILHDLKEEDEKSLLPGTDNDTQVFSAYPKVKPCVGCMGCWIKTPGKCVIEDRAQDYLKYMSQSNELHIISRMSFGGLSSNIKAILDRSIGHMLPFFCIGENEMYHPPRYDKNFSIHYHIYSANSNIMTPAEKATIEGIAEANARNFAANDYSCTIYEDISKIEEVFL